MSFLHIPVYAAWLTGQVVLAATEVIADTFRPRQKQKPTLIGMPLRVTTDNEIVGLSASITMTPGTLVCGTRGLADGGRMFIVHAIMCNIVNSQTWCKGQQLWGEVIREFR